MRSEYDPVNRDCRASSALAGVQPKGSLATASFPLPCAGTDLRTCPNDLQSEADVKGKHYYFNQIRSLCIAA